MTAGGAEWWGTAWASVGRPESRRWAWGKWTDVLGNILLEEIWGLLRGSGGGCESDWEPGI